ncbi:MAG: hypothetical protein J2P36_39055, partial [Ktedonobacteraceae bacterium]|nr:hypothetical protein [Ktedonobacteraceae bacterium]
MTESEDTPTAQRPVTSPAEEKNDSSPTGEATSAQEEIPAQTPESSTPQAVPAVVEQATVTENATSAEQSQREEAQAKAPESTHTAQAPASPPFVGIEDLLAL